MPKKRGPRKRALHRALCIFDRCERLREFCLQNHGTVSVNTEHLQVPPAAATSAALQQTFDPTRPRGLPSRPTTVMRPRLTLGSTPSGQGTGTGSRRFEGVEVDEDDVNL